MNVFSNRSLLENPSLFYLIMTGCIIDRSIKPQNNKISVCYFDGEFTIKRIKVEKDGVYLMPENETFQPMKVTNENDLIIWRIVTYVIKSL